jgi:hypothetical protein
MVLDTSNKHAYMLKSEIRSLKAQVEMLKGSQTILTQLQDALIGLSNEIESGIGTATEDEKTAMLILIARNLRELVESSQ